MGRDSSELLLDSHITDAVRHAILIYGDGVLDDPGLLEILRDHGAFHRNTCADDIIRILIDNGHLRDLYKLSRKENNDIIVGVDREVCNIRYMCSFYEKDIRNVLLSIVKGMNMSLDIQLVDSSKANDLQSFIRPEYDISESIDIDPDDLIEPPSCAIPSRKKPKGNQEGEATVEYTQEITTVKKDKRRKKRILAYAGAVTIALVLSAGVFAILDNEKGEPKDTPSEASETHADRIYREVLEDIQSHNGQISPAGREKLERALRDYPDDYWFKFIKEKTK